MLQCGYKTYITAARAATFKKTWKILCQQQSDQAIIHPQLADDLVPVLPTPPHTLVTLHTHTHIARSIPDPSRKPPNFSKWSPKLDRTWPHATTWVPCLQAARHRRRRAAPCLPGTAGTNNTTGSQRSTECSTENRAGPASRKWEEEEADLRLGNVVKADKDE
jgi:hypothetical protein